MNPIDSRVRNPREREMRAGRYADSNVPHMIRPATFILLVAPILGLGITAFRHPPSHVAPSRSPYGAVMLPGMGTAKTANQPVFAGFKDAHTVTYLATDTSSKNQAAVMHINYSAALAADQASPSIYLVDGRTAPHQVAVFGSEPGEQDYSPLWRETIVTWKAGVNRLLLTSAAQILALTEQGKLTVTANGVVLNCPIVSIGRKSQ